MFKGLDPAILGAFSIPHKSLSAHCFTTGYSGSMAHLKSDLCLPARCKQITNTSSGSPRCEAWWVAKSRLCEKV